MLLFFLLLFSCGNVLAQDTAREWKVYDLKCDNETSPLGLDNPQPSFSWALESSVRGILQTSYRILVASSPEQLASNQGDMWDSGECESAQATGIPYQGNPLQTFGKYYWKVFTKIQGEGFWSAPASFEMGFMNDKDWPGGWICYATGMPGRVLYYKATLAPGQNVREARAYVSGLGYYELEINHKKVGENVLDPAQSSYGKRCYYTTYDITDCLLPEPNTIVIAVAPGWYGTPKLRFFLRAVLEDGNAILYTSDNMRCVTAGSTVYSTVFDGEQYDPREENPELYTPFQPPLLMNKHWAFAYNIDEPYGRMASQRVEPIRVVDTFAPARIERLPNGDYIVDAGRNMAGWARIRVQGEAGQKVRMRFAETLCEDGTVNQDNLRNAKAEDTYTLAGEGVEVWEPRFTYHGFRYAQVWLYGKSKNVSYRDTINDRTTVIIDLHNLRYNKTVMDPSKVYKMAFRAPKAGKVVIDDVYLTNDDQEATAIRPADTATNPFRAPLYSLDGRLADPKALKPGVYISDGKKFVVR